MQTKLKKIFGNKQFIFTKRCNQSIKIALNYAKNQVLSKNKTNLLLIQQEGGWITYRQIAKKLKLNTIQIKTNYGLIDAVELKKFKNCTLIMHSSPGYIQLENMKKIFEICNQNNILLINDSCGSVGTKQAKYGHLIVCSFGKYKPIDIGCGGIILYEEKLKDIEKDINLIKINNHKFTEDSPKEIILDKLPKELNNLREKLKFFNETKEKQKQILKDKNIIYLESQGINLFTETKNNAETEKIIKHCKDNKIYWVECPKYIRLMKQGISLEIKRLNYEV
ncbi:DegT/DnrJ/EryC1/StrS family aminotransferase [Candidatus Woesearchaeota archaeon]|nr:DegT/DnrJ/EryC1/StrS family aminotransferase [Candidatus Woesearchaeota archaeon]